MDKGKILFAIPISMCIIRIIQGGKMHSGNDILSKF